MQWGCDYLFFVALLLMSEIANVVALVHAYVASFDRLLGEILHQLCHSVLNSHRKCAFKLQI